MRIFLILIAAILVLILGGVATLFTPFGNNLLKPYAQDLASQKSGMNIALDEFIIGFKSAKITAKINDAINASVVANYNLFSQNFNANFAANSADLASLGVELKELVSINGSAVGNIKDFDIQSRGTLGAGELELTTKIVDFNLGDLNIDAKKLPLATISTLALKKPYIVGFVDIKAQLSGLMAGSGTGSGTGSTPTSDSAKRGGDATILVQNAVLNSELIKSDFGVDLGKNFTISLNAKGALDGPQIKGGGVLDLPFGQINASSASYNIINGNAAADIAAKIPNLAALEPILGQKLNGAADLNGKVSLNGGELGADGTIRALGGQVAFNLAGEALAAKIAGLNASEAFKLIGQKPLIDGTISGDINAKNILSSAQNIQASAALSLANGTINSKNMSELSGLDFPASRLAANATSVVNGGVADFEVLANSDLFAVEKFKGRADFTAALQKSEQNNADKSTQNSSEAPSTPIKINADYTLNIADLSKLAFITKRPLNGAIKLDGDMLLDGGGFKMSAGSGEFLGGKLDILLKNELATVDFSGFSVEEVQKMLAWQPVYLGESSLNAAYNLAKSSGDFTLNLHEGKLAKNGLTQAVLLLLKRDISGEVYKDGLIKGAINDGKITFDALLNSPKSEIKIDKGQLNLNDDKLDIIVVSNFEKTDINAHITGTTDTPKYDIKSSYLAKKIDKEVDKGLDKLFDGDEEKKDKAKKVLEGLKQFF